MSNLLSVSSQQLVPHILPQLRQISPGVIVPTQQGLFCTRAWAFADGSEHLSLQALEDDGSPVGGNITSGQSLPAVRVHSECATGDIFGSFRCDCGPQLEKSMHIIQELGGYLIYTRNHEGRGIGLVNKLRAYALQDQGLDTVEANLELGLSADQRDYRQVAIILEQLGLNEICLITNNPAKVTALKDLGIRVVENYPDEIPPRAENARYLATKQERMNHCLHFTFEGE